MKSTPAFAGDGCECPMSNTKVPRVVPATNAKTRQGVPEFPLVGHVEAPYCNTDRLEPILHLVMRKVNKKSRHDFLEYPLVN
jgi:hypothetical protein